MENHDVLWVEAYDGEGDGAKLIFQATSQEWEMFRNTRGWDIMPKEKPAPKTAFDGFKVSSG